MIAFLLALLLWTTPVWGQPAPPVGTWAQLSGTAVYPAQPFEAKSASAPGGTPELWSPQGLFAYSGGDVCQLPGGATWGFLLKGGGHGDSPDMSLYWVPLDGSGPQRLTGPYLAPDKAYYYDTPWETYRGTSRNQAPATPSGQVGKARHTYSSLVCAPETGLVFMVGGSITSGSGGGTNATRTYDLTQTTVQAMARPDMGWALKAPAPRSAVASASGWDPVRRRVVTRSSNFIGAYDPATNTWEAWNPPSAPYGSDFQASVAMDVAGRKMYVVGDRLAEMLDLDTKAYTDLRGRPWAAALPGVGSGYLPGPGVSWHARTKQLVVWVGGQSLRLINPLTDEARTLTMTGATVTAASGSGTYGRFRVIPGTDQVVVVNAVDQNVFIGTVPFDGGPVPPPPPPPSSPFVVGALVQTTESLNVRQTPGIPSTILGVQPSGATGTLLEGPVTASGYTWWRIDYATGADGWSAQAYLAVVAPPPVPTLTVDVQLSVGLGLTLTRRSTNTGTPVDLTVDQDTVVRVNGQLVPAPPTPPSPPSGAGVILVPPGQPIPVRQWVERPLPPQGQAYMAGAGGKHGRAFYHPRFSGLVFAGGDWKTSQPTLEAGNGTGSEVWTLNARTDTWTRLRPFCVPGEPQPGSPDTVGWAYDSVRDRGIMTPGFYFITQGATDPCGSVYGWGAYAFSFVTGKFTGPDAGAGLPPPPSGWGGDSGASFAVYNSMLDEYVRVFGTQLQRLSLATRTWRVQSLSTGNPTWNPIANRAQLVLDARDQTLYFVDTTSRAVVRIALATAAVTLVPLPPQYVAPPGDHDVYLALDPTARALLVPNNVDMGQSTLNGLGVLSIATGLWEWLPVPAAVMGSVWGFDENLGVLVGIGKRRTPTAYYLYRVR